MALSQVITTFLRYVDTLDTVAEGQIMTITTFRRDFGHS
jgi:hypothetical protein